MKVLKLVFVLALTFVIFPGCDDANITPSPQIEGEWSFTNLSCFCPTGGETYNLGDIVFDFENTGNVTISINTSLAADSYFPWENGDNLIYFVNGSEISLDGYTYDLLIDGDSMSISDEPASDGPQYLFER